jgi:hypothetical protein
MKKYRRIASWTLRIRPKEEYRFDELGEVILAPDIGSPFLHWYTPNNKLSATTTLDEHMVVSTPVRIVNGSDDFILVNVIEI